ncbi:hypothetical protein QYE76_043084 [Lolium multiflorum]|uniref:CCHC-type domain-containing protein n=1 Tax=Lolium multiflorum TaxID=4521 RepID=A0AAD8TGV2_LOLMU|nr:hypothetical protein QYE76_043084 [Lolium multiflorum]
MENNLEVAGVEAAEKVLFATHYLSGPARAWWTSARAMNAGQMMNWEDFKLKFSKYHVPQGLIKKMRDEFRELKQGRMSVVEYRDRFLTCQAIQMEGKLHQANENRKRRMMNQNGPHHTQKHRNNSSGGFTPRHNKPPAQNYRPSYTHNNGGPPKPGGNHDNNNNNNHNNHSNPNNNNNNHGNHNNTNTGPRTGSNAIPVTPKDKSTVNCYECGVVGHYSNECPKKLARIAAQLTTTAPLRRNPSKEIFSELDETFAQGPILHEASETEELTKWGHEAVAVAARARRADLPWAPRVAPALTLRLLKASVAKPRREPRYGKPSRLRRESHLGDSDRLRHLPERGFISRRTLHRHGRLSDE